MLKISENNGTEEIGLITPTPGVIRRSRIPGPWFNVKMSSYQYKESHCGDKTISWPSYLHNGISYTGKTTFLYWIRRLLSGANLTTIALKPLIVILYSFQLKFGKSHNTPVSYPTMHHLRQKCAHVCTFLLQNGVLWNICLIIVVVILFRTEYNNTIQCAWLT